MCDHCGCREFAPIAELTAEHERILELAWTVAESAEPPSPDQREARVRLAALLDLHALKEEIGLYPQLVGTGDLDPEHCHTLEDEHRGTHRALAGTGFGRNEYYALAAHIEEEEMELFSGAMFAFDDLEWDQMAAAHHAAEHEMGVAHHH